MAYLVLARKWRPRSFDTLIGQDHVVRALTNALSTQRLHHAWLFTGTRGVGKTTLSRILAKSLNCETGITATPCGVCQACTEIDSGRFVDYIELDAASNRGVDEMTQLLEQAVYSPSTGRYKVYMIDEVHMLTGHAFNAMLKTLEEPPPHVKFILATTDPQKIPVTVLSRCLQFNLKQMTAESMVGHLQHILEQEHIQYETPALRLIAKAASGSMRDALSLTDQAIAYSAGNLTDEAIQGMLGTIDQRHLVRLLQALSDGSGSQVLQVADELATRGLSYSGALADLSVLLSRIAIEQRVSGTVPADDPLLDDIVGLARAMHPDLVQLFYSVAVHSRHELSLAPDEYAGFVMACLRMLALAPASANHDRPPVPAVEPPVLDTNVPEEDVPEPGPRPEAPKPEAPKPEAPKPEAPKAGAAASFAPPRADVPVEPEHVREVLAWEDEPDDDVVPDIPPEEMDEVAAPVFAAQPKASETPRLASMTAEAWPALAAQLPLSGLVSELARQSEWVGVRGDQVTLRVAVRSLAEIPGKARLCTVLSEHFGTAVQLNVEFGATGDETAHAVEQSRRAERQLEAEQAVNSDPFVQALVNEFGARVVPGSVRAASPDRNPSPGG